MTVETEKKPLSENKPDLYSVYINNEGMTDVRFTAKEIITPRLLNMSIRSINVRYRQYLRDHRKVIKQDNLRSLNDGNKSTAEK